MVRIIRILLVLCFCAFTVLADERGAALKLEEIRHSPLLLRQFLEAMPKGGDLHNHLYGAVYAESYLRWAAEDGFCIDKSKLQIAPPPCEEANGLVLATAGVLDGTLYSQIVDAMSMRNYNPATENGHDRFFATFGKYRAVSRTRVPDMLADVVGREARDNVDYVELIAELDAGAARELGSKFDSNASIESMYSVLTAVGSTLPDIVARSRKLIDDAEAGMKAKLRCGMVSAEPGCDATMRWIFEIHRGYPRTAVFTEIVAGFALATADARVVALNPVMPEDAWTSMNDFGEQMRMFRFLKTKFPKVHLTMHAGELAPGLVPPEGLRDHIRESFRAGAERIGHGVDIARETNMVELLRAMVARPAAVEICLTSNDVILGISGRKHPLRLYLHHGVPVVFATDDPGVSRGDLTTEFQRAIEEHGLDYADIKRAARNSIQFSFLEGASLWKDASYTLMAMECVKGGKPCELFLRANPKAREQARLERRLQEFEAIFQ